MLDQADLACESPKLSKLVDGVCSLVAMVDKVWAMEKTQRRTCRGSLAACIDLSIALQSGVGCLGGRQGQVPFSDG